MPRNNQLLHFAFREDKQWKLQQVTRPFPDQSSGHKGRQRQAGLYSGTEASGGWTLRICYYSKPGTVFPGSKAGVGGAWGSRD